MAYAYCICTQWLIKLSKYYVFTILLRKNQKIKQKGALKLKRTKKGKYLERNCNGLMINCKSFLLKRNIPWLSERKLIRVSTIMLPKNQAVHVQHKGSLELKKTKKGSPK